MFYVLDECAKSDVAGSFANEVKSLSALILNLQFLTLLSVLCIQFLCKYRTEIYAVMQIMVVCVCRIQGIVQIEAQTIFN